MEKIVYLDVAALLIILVLLVTSYFRKMTVGKTNKWFLFLTISILVADVADIISILLDNNASSGDSIAYERFRFFSHSVYLFSHNITTIFLIVYIVALTDTWHKLKKNKFTLIIFSVPFFVLVISLLVNVKSRIIFDIVDGEYVRNKYFVILYIVAVFYLFSCIGYMIMYKKLFSAMEFIAIFSMIPMMIVAFIYQYFKPFSKAELLANALGALFIASMIQRPEATTNYVTGLCKYRAYKKQLQKAFATNKTFDLVLINCSNFTAVQNMIGYANADIILQSIARQLKVFNKTHHLDAELFYAGQGRFSVMLSGRHTSKTEEVARQFNAALKPYIPVKDMQIGLVAIVSILHVPEDINSMQSYELYTQDLAKLQYTGDVIKASTILKSRCFDVMYNLEAIIEESLASGFFQVYYQPIYSTKENSFKSAEALLRLIHPVHGSIPPDIFIKVAEKSGAINKIGDFVLDEVCKFISSNDFKTLGIEYIEVNLSAVECMRPDIIKMADRTLDMYNVSKNQIAFEVTETTAGYSQSILEENIFALSKAGYKMCLDDYGTGYSNLQRIIEYPFSIIKLDKLFAAPIRSDKFSMVIHNTINLMEGLSMETVIEGVETKELVENFIKLGCNYIQGYYFSKPLPRNAFVDFVRNYKH